MYCKKCGALNDVGSKFCRTCGAPLEKEDALDRNDGKPALEAHLESVPLEEGDKPVISPIVDEKSSVSPNNAFRIMLLSFLITIIVLGGCMAALFGGLYLKDKKEAGEESTVQVAETSAETGEADVETEDIDKNEAETDAPVTEYENGDIVYISSQENLAIDTDESVLYYDNLLIVYTLSDLSESEAASLAAQVNGTVVGDISGAVNFLQIQVNATDLATLNSYAEILMESEEVLYASYDVPMMISDDALASDNNPWTNQENEDGEIVAINDKGNEDNPDGNDWWAEAIGAYTAWEYVDSHEDELTDVTVGIIDSGFDVDHEDLSNIKVLNNNTAEDHGTHVAGIIAANNNSVGIRGIVDRATVLYMDWKTTIVDENGDDTATSLISTGEWVEYTKQMIESGARVVNNSWGFNRPSTEEGWLKYFEDIGWINEGNNLDIKYKEMDDEKFWEMQFAITSKKCVWLMVSLINAYNEGEISDFIIVQSSGNGYDNSGPGYPASENGFFCSITEQNFQAVAGIIVEQMGITYEEIKSHIMIVGAVENVTDENGNYLVTSYSNYGLDSVDICAPGGEYSDTNDGSVEIFSLLTDSGYGGLYGTSMAAPMVSAAAALVWSVDPTLTAAEVKEILTTNISSHAVGVTDDDAGMLYPMLNVGLAVLATAGVADNTDCGTETTLFESLPESFSLTSGAGNWSDNFKLSADGSFTGTYYDLNMGECGDEYSSGTIYICNYSGKFSLTQQLDEYRFSAKVEYINMENEAGTIYYEDDYRYICVASPFLNYGDELIIYMQGCPISDMEEDYVFWWNPMLFLTGDIWPAGHYGIYNVDEEIGYYGYRDNGEEIEENESTAQIEEQTGEQSDESDVSSVEHIDLTNYLDSISKMYSVVGGIKSSETGDHEEWYICDDLQYGNYIGSEKVDELTVDGKEWLIYNIYIGKNINTASTELEALGWTCVSKTNDTYYFEKDELNIIVRISDNLITGYGFWRDMN